MSGIHLERDRADSFGNDAERYDRTRPSYPTELIDWLSSEGTGDALDVGCGTGQLTRLLAAAGWNVTGVEADARMAAVARTHGVNVDVAPFEQWAGPEGTLSLICSAQAWHWIDPAVGHSKAAHHLAPGGTLALMWNSYQHTAEAIAVFHDVFGRHAPTILDHPVPLGTASLDHEANDAITADHLAPHFSDLAVTTFEHGRSQLVDDWLDECLAHSPVALLPEDVLTQLLDEQRAALLTEIGPELQVRYTTRVTTARRR